MYLCTEILIYNSQLMVYFTEVLHKNELKNQYRQLAKLHHPDRGGSSENMQGVNKEFEFLKVTCEQTPNSLHEVMLGNHIYVNSSKCVVTAVEPKLFKVRSLVTKREGYFEKSTGFGLFNYHFRARCCN